MIAQPHRVRPRRSARAAALPVLVALAVAGCTSSAGAKHGTSTPTGSTSTAGRAADRRALIALLHRGVAGVTSAHVELAVSIAGLSLAGAGDEQLSAGRAQAVRVVQDLGGSTGKVEVIFAGGNTYGKLPASINTTGKPYVLVSADSKNATIAQLAASVDSLLASASLDSVATLLGAASSVRDLGAATIGGARAEHYSAVVVPAMLPTTFPPRAGLVQAGLKTVPLEVFVDPTGRPVQVTEVVSELSQQVDVRLTIARFNRPVTISAPAANQVGRS